MYKALALTALASTAAAAWNQEIVPYTQIKNSEGTFSYYNLKLSASFDTGYQTAYNKANPGSMYQSAMADSQQGYSLNIFSWVRLTFWHEAFEAYQANYDFTLDLLDFTPVGESV